MGLANYTELVASIQDWTIRSDSAFAAVVPDFIKLAEDRIFLGSEGEGTEPLRVKEMQTDTSVSFTAGVSGLPANFLESIALTRPGDKYGLDFSPASRFEVEKSLLDSGGNPGYFTIKNSAIELAPSWDGSLDLYYYGRPNAITSGNSTNAVLTAYPAIYLNACLVAAFDWIQDEEQSAKYLTKTNSAIIGANNVTSKGQRSGVNKRLKVRPRGVV